MSAPIPEPAVNYAVGRNLAGYLPESDVVVFDTWRDAAEYLASEMKCYADTDDDAVWQTLPDDHADDEMPSMLATVESILRDDPPKDGQEFGAIVEDNDGRMISFWLMFTDEPVSDES
jgi:hypothetical protein